MKTYLEFLKNESQKVVDTIVANRHNEPSWVFGNYPRNPKKDKYIAYYRDGKSKWTHWPHLEDDHYFSECIYTYDPDLNHNDQDFKEAIENAIAGIIVKIENFLIDFNKRKDDSIKQLIEHNVSIDDVVFKDSYDFSAIYSPSFKHFINGGEYIEADEEKKVDLYFCVKIEKYVGYQTIQEDFPEFFILDKNKKLIAQISDEERMSLLTPLRVFSPVKKTEDLYSVFTDQKCLSTVTSSGNYFVKKGGEIGFFSPEKKFLRWSNVGEWNHACITWAEDFKCDIDFDFSTYDEEELPCLLKGVDERIEYRNKLDEFVVCNFDSLYEGAVKLGYEIEEDYHAPRRIQIRETRLHASVGLKYACGHKYSDLHPISETQLKETLLDLKELIQSYNESYFIEDTKLKKAINSLID